MKIGTASWHHYWTIISVDYHNLGNKCLAWKCVLGNNKLRGYPLTEQSTYQSFLSRVQAVQSLHKFHQACDLFDEPRKKNTGKIVHYLPNQRVQRKKTHLTSRPLVSGYFWKRIFFFRHFNLLSPCERQAFRAPKKRFSKTVTSQSWVFENAVLSFSSGRTKTELFEYNVVMYTAHTL